MADGDTAALQNARDEMHVISAALAHASNRERFVALLRSEDFTVPECKVLAWGIRKAFDEKREPDARTFHTLVEDCPHGKKFGGHELVSKLIGSCPSPLADFETLAGRVRLIGTKDRAYSTLLRAAEVASDPTKDLSALRSCLEDTEAVIESAGTRDSMGFKTPAEVNVGYSKTLRERIAGLGFAPTGLAPLDDALHQGFLPGRITTLAGRPSNGKTTFLANLMYRTAAIGKRSVGLFSVEAPDIAIWDKFISITTGIPLVKLEKNASTLSIPEKQMIHDAMRRMESLPLEINDKKTFTVSEMEEAIARRFRQGRRFDVVVVDLFTRAAEFDNDNLRGGGTQPNAIMGALKRIQDIAERYKFHAVLVVQIGRFDKESRHKDQQSGSKKRRMLRPTENDVYGADAYLQVSDNMILIHRCHQIDPIRYREDIIEVWIRKQRYGEPTMRCFLFQGEVARVVPTDHFPVDFTDEEKVMYGYKVQGATFAKK